jgi:hypothetical protein
MVASATAWSCRGVDRIAVPVSVLSVDRPVRLNQGPSFGLLLSASELVALAGWITVSRLPLVVPTASLTCAHQRRSR